MPEVTLITCTGARPDAFALCEKYIKNQTYFQGQGKSPQWIVVDDCTPLTELKLGEERVIGPRHWEPGVNTQRYNMEAALRQVKGEYVFIIEDDDYFNPFYIEVMMGFLKHADIVGLSNSRYYGLHVPGWKEMKNYAHASLTQTGFKKSLVPHLIKAVNSGELYFDVHVWRQARDLKIPLLLIANRNFSIGIKGMPGREGITGFHKDRDYYVDSEYTVLKEWLGRDFNNYLPYLRSRDGKEKRNMQLSVDDAKQSRATPDRGSSPNPNAGREEITRRIGGK